MNEDKKVGIDHLIQDIKDNGVISISGDFNIQFQYSYDEDLPEHIRGFSIEILPKGRDGTGIIIRFDPYDKFNSSGIIKVIEENGKEI